MPVDGVGKYLDQSLPIKLAGGRRRGRGPPCIIHPIMVVGVNSWKRTIVFLRLHLSYSAYLSIVNTGQATHYSKVRLESKKQISIGQVCLMGDLGIFSGALML